MLQNNPFYPHHAEQNHAPDKLFDWDQSHFDRNLQSLGKFCQQALDSIVSVPRDSRREEELLAAE